MSTHSDDHPSFQEPKPLTAPQTQAALDFGSPSPQASSQAVAGPIRLQVNATQETTPRAFGEPSTSSLQRFSNNLHQTMEAYSRTTFPQTAVPVGFVPAGSYPIPVTHGYQNVTDQHLQAACLKNSLSSMKMGKRKAEREYNKPYQRPHASRKGKEREVDETYRPPQEATQPFCFEGIGHAKQMFCYLKNTHPGIKAVHTLFMVPPGAQPFNGAWKDSDQHWRPDNTALQSKFALLFVEGSFPVRLINPHEWVGLIRLIDRANICQDGIGKTLELAVTPSGDVVEVHYPVWFFDQYTCTMPFPPTTPFFDERPDLTSRDLRLEISQMDIALSATHDGSSNQPAPTPPEVTLLQLAAANEAEARRKAIEEEPEASY